MCDSDSGLSLSMNGSQVDSACPNELSICIRCFEIGYEHIHSFSSNELISNVKAKIITKIEKQIKDHWNYGLFLPPSKGRSGKFLLEDRQLRDYPFANATALLELKYKQRVFRTITANMSKLKKIQNKVVQRQFLEYVKLRDIEKVNKLLNKGLDPNFQSRDTGDTPLCLAVRDEQPREMIIALVASGAHLDYRAADTMSPLHRAASLGNFEAVKVILELGQSPNIWDRFHLTPLYYAVLSNIVSLCVERLLYEHAEVGVTDEAGLQEIHQACRFGRVEHLDFLILYGSDINSQTGNKGNTPLHICSIMGHEACARLLLFRGANRAIVNSAGHTAHQQAILSDHSQLADLILNYQNKDVVPQRCVPTRNPNRRAASQGLRARQRCSSIGRPSTLLDCKEQDSTGSHTHDPSSCQRMVGSISGYCLDSITSHDSDQATPDPNYSVTMRSVNRLQGQPWPDFDTYTDSAGNLPERRFQINTTSPANRMSHGSDVVSIFSTTSSPRERTTSNFVSSASTLQIMPDERVNFLHLDTTNLPRMVVLQRGPGSFGFVIRGRKDEGGGDNFQPSLEVPATQYLESVKVGTAASRAGLKPGDFILEVNSVNVTTMPHEDVVHLIRASGDILALKVVTVAGTCTQPTMASTNQDTSTYTLPKSHWNMPAEDTTLNASEKAWSGQSFSTLPNRAKSLRQEPHFTALGRSENTSCQRCIPPPPPLLPLVDREQPKPSPPKSAGAMSQQITTNRSRGDAEFPVPAHLGPLRGVSPTPPRQNPPLPIPAPPPLPKSLLVNSSNVHSPPENILASLMKKPNMFNTNGLEEFPLPPPPPESSCINVTNDATPDLDGAFRQKGRSKLLSFDDNLKEAIARRRRKIETSSSDDESTKNAGIISNHQGVNVLRANSTLYTAATTNSCRNPSVTALRCDGKGQVSDKRGFLSQRPATAEASASILVKAEKFQVGTLPKTLPMNNTIPPPEKFEDKSSRLNAHVRMAKSPNECDNSCKGSLKTADTTNTTPKLTNFFANSVSSSRTSTQSSVPIPPPPMLLNKPTCHQAGDSGFRLIR